MFSLPPLPNSQLFDDRGYPTATMQIYWQQLTEYLGGAIDTLATVTNTTLPGFQQAITQAQTAANGASQAAAAANTAAGNANAAANAASATAAANAREQALVNSYIDPNSVLTATPTTISIAAHTRHYANGTTASVSAGTVAATAAGDVDYVFYSDPTRTGGSVSFQASTTQPPQTGDTHVVGAVMVPTTGTANGGYGPQKPGYVQPRQQTQ